MQLFKTFIGVDISKNDFLTCFNELSEPIKYANNNAGITELMSDIVKLGVLKKEVVIGVESTGSYHLPLAIICSRQGYTVKVINPIITHAHANSSIRKVKTDKADSKIIRLCLIKGAGEVFQETAEETILKNLLRQRYFLVGLKARLIVKQQDITLKEECLKMPISSLNYELREVVEKKIIFLEQQLEAHKSREQALLKTIPGVGKVTAMTILTEISNINKFNTPKKLVGFIGVDSKIKESGISIKVRGHISKRGNRMIRKTLYNAAMVAIQRPNIFRDFYLKKLSEGKAKNVCLCAVMRKMIHVIYAVLKRQSEFVPR